MKNVCVIFGGANSEHEVSLRSVSSILENMDTAKYNIIMVGITKRGQWYHYTGEAERIQDGSWENTPYLEPCLISPDPTVKGLLLLGERPVASVKVRRRLLEHTDIEEYIKPREERVVPIDVVFPVLHGRKGEDGTIQGLFEMAELPYVGCGVLSSAMCMDKEIAHIVLTHRGVNKTKLVAVHTPDREYETLSQRMNMLEEEIGYPMFVKPANEGSSVGITKATNRSELKEGIKEAFLHDKKIVVEKTLVGREIECSVWGNEEPYASKNLGEIIPTRDFYDYEGKYLDDSAGLEIPAKLEQETVDAVRAMAVKAYTALECTGLARVDFFVQNDGTPVINELNTLPGFTSISMYPKLLMADGISFPETIDNLIGAAFQRKQR